MCGFCDVSKIEVGGVASVMLSKIEREGICDVGGVLMLFCLREGREYVM